MSSDLQRLLVQEQLELEAEFEDLQGRIGLARERLGHVQSRLVHVRALLGEKSTQNDLGDEHSSEHDDVKGKGSSACDIAVEVLSERSGQPMYYKDLTQEVMRRGGELNGATPWANLTARLVQDPRFVRPTAKGFYALRKDYPNARNVGARAQRRRRGA